MTLTIYFKNTQVSKETEFLNNYENNFRCAKRMQSISAVKE